MKPVRYLASYDESLFERYLEENFSSIEHLVLGELENENLNGAIIKMEEQIAKAYKVSKKKKKVNNDDKADIKKMEEANEHFSNLQKCLNGTIIADKNELLEIYQNSRKSISKDIYSKEKKRWDEVTTATSCKSMWERIDWKGNIGKQAA